MLLTICITLFAMWGFQGIHGLSFGSLMCTRGSESHLPISQNNTVFQNLTQLGVQLQQLLVSDVISQSLSQMETNHASDGRQHKQPKHTNNLGNSSHSIVPLKLETLHFPFNFHTFPECVQSSEGIDSYFLEFTAGLNTPHPHTLHEEDEAYRECFLTVWADILSKRMNKSIMNGSAS